LRNKFFERNCIAIIQGRISGHVIKLNQKLMPVLLGTGIFFEVSNPIYKNKSAATVHWLWQ
jgi:hypothetical protein